LGKYHAVTPAEARATGRIYALDRLPTLMNDETTSVAVNHEIKMVVKYPLYPTLIMIALGLLLVAVIWLAVMGLRRLAPAARSRWNVFLVDDTRSAEMVGTKVVLGDEEVGSVVSDRFIPSGRAALANGQAEAVLVDGAIVDLRILHRLTRVRFEVKGKKKQKQAAAPAAPDDIPRR
ncbi:MAG: hypothetical protein NTY38_29515, partial [Acidobacteria bacterium]|nr:hypothetical protein [Acidobacteriota bacterium]